MTFTNGKIVDKNEVQYGEYHINEEGKFDLVIKDKEYKGMTKNEMVNFICKSVYYLRDDVEPAFAKIELN